MDEKTNYYPNYGRFEIPKDENLKKRSKLDPLTLHLKHMNLVHMFSLLGSVNFKLVGDAELEVQFGCPLHPFPFVPTIVA